MVCTLMKVPHADAVQEFQTCPMTEYVASSDDLLKALHAEILGTSGHVSAAAPRFVHVGIGLQRHDTLQ